MNDHQKHIAEVFYNHFNTSLQDIRKKKPHTQKLKKLKWLFIKIMADFAGMSNKGIINYVGCNYSFVIIALRNHQGRLYEDSQYQLMYLSIINQLIFKGKGVSSEKELNSICQEAIKRLRSIQDINRELKNSMKLIEEVQKMLNKLVTR